MPNDRNRDVSAEEFAQTYDFLDISGKSVVDVGADWGSSAAFFLNRGAAMVYAFEADPVAHSQLATNYSRDPRVQVFDSWSGQYVPAEILKMDCEGCEAVLTIPFIAQYKQYAIALHPARLTGTTYTMLRDYMISDGAKTVFVTSDRMEEMYVKTTSLLGRLALALHG